MKRKAAGRILALPLAVIMLALPGCAGIQEHWTVPGSQTSAIQEEEDGEAARKEAEARENALREEEARLQREAALKEIEARENARKAEEARLQREAARKAEEARLQREAAHREEEAQELARWQEELRRERETEEAARREVEAMLEAWESARREEEARLQRDTALREAEERENARREEEARRLLESLEAARGSAENPSGETGLIPLPRYYVVRPGDTFNRIAADPRIYNSPGEWFVLYQANRDKLRDPDDPDQLTAGTVIDIPSIAGETREGTY